MIVRCLLLFCTASLSADTPLCAQRSAVPPVRAHHSVTYDPIAKRVLLAGGSTAVDGGKQFVFYDDVWAYDGKWTLLHRSNVARSGERLAFDSHSNVLYSFGGFDGSNALVAFRRFNGTVWENLAAPPRRPTVEAGLVYDSKRKRLITFGGSASPDQFHGDTWEFDGTVWHQVATNGPSPRQAFVMVYDSKRSRTVLFGGLSPTGQYLGDTWEFDNTGWKQVSNTGPAARAMVGAAFDSKRGVVIIFGGGTKGGFLNDTWQWDGAEWKQLGAAGPDARAMGQLAHDEARGRIVLFGGRKSWPNDLNDTWEWNGDRWERISF